MSPPLFSIPSCKGYGIHGYVYHIVPKILNYILSKFFKYKLSFRSFTMQENIYLVSSNSVHPNKSFKFEVQLNSCCYKSHLILIQA